MRRQSLGAYLAVQMALEGSHEHIACWGKGPGRKVHQNIVQILLARRCIGFRYSAIDDHVCSLRCGLGHTLARVAGRRAGRPTYLVFSESNFWKDFLIQF